MIVECPACESRYDVTGRPAGTKARCRCGQLFLLPNPPQSAASLSCPECGGNVKAGTSKCEFCEAALLVKACPRCFARIFHGAKHCNDCGAEVDVPANVNADGTARQLTCPRCDATPTMEARLVGDTLMDECPECHGIWLDAAAVSRLVKERRQVSSQAVIGMGGPEAGSARVACPPGRVYVKCPECDTVMNRTNFAKRSGIIIDSCKGHGTWFDADELPRVVEFVMNGGIEAANERSMQQAKEEVRKARSKVRAMQQSSSMSTEAHVRHTRISSANSFTGLLGIIGSVLLD
ncbi:MAG: hypothetical protein GY811_24105 [Myxococcales bacterium]|nr:hypothetical protein [Myxococcales bacterium]